MKRVLGAVGEFCKRASYLVRATAWAALLGIIETVTSQRHIAALPVRPVVTLSCVYPAASAGVPVACRASRDRRAASVKPWSARWT